MCLLLIPLRIKLKLQLQSWSFSSLFSLTPSGSHQHIHTVCIQHTIEHCSQLLLLHDLVICHLCSLKWQRAKVNKCLVKKAEDLST